mmetsp:Transcript_115362/g.172382  ORF Transcript_115362/g.172382 Transcript_115362/m.172382 type:complete len:86 (+) Transcript_115362:103-360(+)|eukprot:CAMPEP_0117010120 /NCGR_PEP_ID=MMETSP0472-20121206/9003_1 /TAXON_ID=693140 ORGANISM="Tiarina fusus, Strain LIS" /NCGR_SAMPLE_ID=MMETSP0472 /ASSEMBLY_ACC=CAM_ASM_000603 /LENGTH=85 /DNA_ID=CAMNT_0004712577 /DNA_START=79 /DNA_END=336 /DNA_ORIENTATION=-
MKPSFAFLLTIIASSGIASAAPPRPIAFLGLETARKSSSGTRTDEIANISRGGTKKVQKTKQSEDQEGEDLSVVMGGGESSFFYF